MQNLKFTAFYQWYRRFFAERCHIQSLADGGGRRLGALHQIITGNRHFLNCFFLYKKSDLFVFGISGSETFAKQTYFVNL